MTPRGWRKLRDAGHRPRFSLRERVALLIARIPVEIARAYPARFSVEDIRDAFGAPGYRGYPPGYEPTAERAATYPERFDARAVWCLARAGVAGDQAADYAARFDAEEILALAAPREWTGLVAPVPAAVAGRYADRFNGYHIPHLVAAAVEPATAGSYAERFTGYDVATLARDRVPPDQAASYPPAIDADMICRLVAGGIDPAMVAEYRRYNIDPEAFGLAALGIAADEAARYLQGAVELDGRSWVRSQDARRATPRILALARAGINPADAAAYARFTVAGISQLRMTGIGPGLANAYPQGVDGHGVVRLQAAGISPEEASRYPGTLGGHGIVGLVALGVTPSQVGDYPARFALHEIGYLASHGLGPEAASASPHRSARDTRRWFQAKGRPQTDPPPESGI